MRLLVTLVIVFSMSSQIIRVMHTHIVPMSYDAVKEQVCKTHLLAVYLVTEAMYFKLGSISVFIQVHTQACGLIAILQIGEKREGFR